MKHILIILALSFLFIPLAEAQRDKVMVQVDGLGCPYCAYGLEKKFKKIKGIKKIEIDMETGDFSFTVPEENEMSLDEVDERVTLAGYTANDVKIERADGTVEVMDFTQEDVATNTKDEWKVFGICKMCKSRIEKVSRKVAGVGSSKWDPKTKLLKVEYDNTLTNVMEIKKALAAIGHDSEDIKADDLVYDNLPACCLYDRSNINQKSH